MTAPNGFPPLGYRSPAGRSAQFDQLGKILGVHNSWRMRDEIDPGIVMLPRPRFLSHNVNRHLIPFLKTMCSFSL